MTIGVIAKVSGAILSKKINAMSSNVSSRVNDFEIMLKEEKSYWPLLEGAREKTHCLEN